MYSLECNTCLEAHDEDCLRTLFRCHSPTVPDGVLCLHTEQEDRGKVVDVDNAGYPVVFVLVVREVLLVEVAVVVDDHPPQQGEGKPRSNKGAEEYEVHIPPTHIKHGVEEV